MSGQAKRGTNTKATLLARALLAVLAAGIAILALRFAHDDSLLAQTSPLMPSPLPIFTPFPTPTLFGAQPTPTPDWRVVNEIVEPRDGNAIAGFVPIMGTALIEDFIKYDVHISPAGAENWQWLKSSTSVVRNGVLHILNTFEWNDGYYDIRVRAIGRDGNYAEAFLRGFEIRNANPPTPTPKFDELGQVQPESPLLADLFPTPTPTPTALFKSNVPNGQGIFAPENGAVLRGQVPIVGTVNGKTIKNPFLRYEIYLAESGSGQWDWIFSSANQYWQSEIYHWDTTRVADGAYDLRLRIVYRDSNYDEYYVSRLRVANQTTPGGYSTIGTEPGLYFPRGSTQVSGVTEFVGTTDVPNLLRWELYWSPVNQDDWHFLVSDTRAAVNATLARLDLRLLPPGSYDFRLRTVRRDYGYNDYYVRNVEVQAPPPTRVPSLED